MAGALASTILVGCVEDDRLIDPIPPAEAPPGSGWTAATLPADSIFADEPMLELAREIPTFAGFYFDENDPERMVVALTDVADLGRAENRIRDVLRADRRPAGAVPTTGFVAHQVEYPFLELARYRTVLRGHVFDIPGVVSLGVNLPEDRVSGAGLGYPAGGSAGEQDPGGVGQWQASVVGGREPYSYTWRIGLNVVGTGSQLFLDTGTQDFQLILEVVDADQGYSSDQKNIDVDPDADPGLFCY